MPNPVDMFPQGNIIKLELCSYGLFGLSEKILLELFPHVFILAFLKKYKLLKGAKDENNRRKAGIKRL